MPFNGSGSFQPLGAPDYPAVAGEVIFASRFNNVVNDIHSGLSATIQKDGQSAMTAPFKLVDGTAAAPGLSFTTEVSSGLFRVNTNVLGLSVGGTERVQFNTTGIGIGVAADSTYRLRANGRTQVGTVEPTSTSVLGTGINLPNVSTLGFFTANTLHMQLSATGNLGIGRLPRSNVRVDIGGLGNDTSLGGNADLVISSANQTVSCAYGWNQIASSGTLTIGVGGVARFQYKATGSIRLVGLSADPATPDPGELYFNTSTGKFRGHTGAGWVDLH